MKRLTLAFIFIAGAFSLSGSNSRIKVEPKPQESLVQSLEELIQLIDETDSMDNNR